MTTRFADIVCKGLMTSLVRAGEPRFSRYPWQQRLSPDQATDALARVALDFHAPTPAAPLGPLPLAPPPTRPPTHPIAAPPLLCLPAAGQLVQPCQCRTPVHARCLSQWVFHSYQRGGRRDPGHCEVCRAAWSGEMTGEVGQAWLP